MQHNNNNNNNKEVFLGKPIQSEVFLGGAGGISEWCIAVKM
jgi:hypothetical protein